MKILVNFEDFGELPPAKGKQLAPSTTYTSQIVLVQLQEISQYLAIYTAVMATHKPHHIPELMAYQTEIAKCAKKYKWASWVIYCMTLTSDRMQRPTLKDLGHLCTLAYKPNASQIWARMPQISGVDHVNHWITPRHPVQ